VYIVTLVVIAALSIITIWLTIGMVGRLAVAGSVSSHDIRHFGHILTYLSVATLLILVLQAFLVFRPLSLQRQKAITAMNASATTDSLTSILNRSTFITTLERELGRAARLRQPLCLLIADIDRFHFLNDRFGAAAGDIVLQHFSASAQQNLRAGDILGRLGGEEFALLLPATGLKDALSAAERIRERFSGTTAAVAPDGHRVTATVSIGIVCALDATASEVLEEADALLSKAKAGGRNRVEAGTLLPQPRPVIVSPQENV
jgi:diguanylate cyclase (GGDEF)-like protein